MTAVVKEEIDIDADRRTVNAGDFRTFKKLFVIKNDIKNIEENGDLIAADSVNEDYYRARNLIYNYIVSVIVASNWYDLKMEVENRQRRLYQCITILLVVTLPIVTGAGVYLLHWLQIVTSVALTSAITAFLTSLVGLQKAWSAWLDSHKRFGSRWRARAALRDIMYTDRDRWCGHAVSDTALQPDFIDALAVSIGKARTAIRLEQQAYFDTFDAPSLDLSNVLSGARTLTTATMQDISKPISAITDAKMAVDSKVGEIDALKTIIADLPTGDASLSALNTSFAAAQRELIIARGKLTGLLASI